jgi:hypothetical protein
MTLVTPNPRTMHVTLMCLLLQIAALELREKKIPFTIRRYLPDGR